MKNLDSLTKEEIDWKVYEIIKWINNMFSLYGYNKEKQKNYFIKKLKELL